MFDFLKAFDHIPQVPVLSEREAMICFRLKAFREGLKISRSKFAVTLGIGSERLASYESARAPIRYEIYRAVSEHFFINPGWLAIGKDRPKLNRPFDDSDVSAQINPRALFSEVFDSHLAAKVKQESEGSHEAFLNSLESLKTITSDDKLMLELNSRHPGFLKKVQEILEIADNKIKDFKIFQERVDASIKGKSATSPPKKSSPR